jgi:hypothetical protein
MLVRKRFAARQKFNVRIQHFNSKREPITAEPVRGLWIDKLERIKASPFGIYRAPYMMK